jgi:hypothetical protein
LESLTFAPYAKEGQYQLSAQKCSGIAEIKSLVFVFTRSLHREPGPSG